MTTPNQQPNTTVPRDEATPATPVPLEESEAAGRSEPTTTVPHDDVPDTTVPRDND